MYAAGKSEQIESIVCRHDSMFLLLTNPTCSGEMISLIKVLIRSVKIELSSFQNVGRREMGL